MSEPVIRVENLSKKYLIGHTTAGSYRTFRDALIGKTRALFRPHSQAPDAGGLEEFWALQAVSFEIQQGDRVGIIGRNGAGKSTLLKILSRITEPTLGRVRMRGRVASLLEVGTGFHPELTGRENIFLNGAILGMGRTEISQKFDAIVAFAEVAKFIDTPVKHYSSGMYVRLAFAVAAHLEPEILIVDEVLAVGDAAFQKKCLGKMEDVSREGRTVLFVSHNIASMRGLCSRALLLEQGKLILDSNLEKVLQKYLVSSNTMDGYWQRTQEPETAIYLLEISVKNQQDQPASLVSALQPFYIDILLQAEKTVKDARIHVRLTNQEGVHVFTTVSTDSDSSRNYWEIPQGRHHYRVTIPPFLKPGFYSLVVAINIPGVELFDLVDGQVSLSVEDVGNHATLLRDDRFGVIVPILEWQKFE